MLSLGVLEELGLLAAAATAAVVAASEKTHER